MCGIVGFFGGDHVSAARLDSMTARLSHRGPDGVASWISADGNVGLGHARLAIIDLESGDQPMVSCDGRYVITFNGEIYNYRALRGELEALGSRFRTNSDTEVLLEAWRTWRAEGLCRLNGMFAFAIFDRVDEVVLLARDRTGIKPLYWTDVAGGLLFGSEIKGFCEHPGLPRRLDREALASFLAFSYPMPPRTGFVGIQELEPGTWMRVSSEGREVGRFWTWSPEPEAAATLDEATEDTLRAVTASVEDHLVSDVPVAAFLSGGIDSSLIVAVASRELGRRLDCLTVGFGDSTYDETSRASRVARELGCPHHKLVVESGTADLDLAGTIMDQYDTLFGDSSAIPTWLISRSARQQVKVALSGDGGDECFAGYTRFRWARTARLLSRAGPLLDLAAFTQPFWPLPAGLVRGGGRMVRAARAPDGRRLDYLSAYHFPDLLNEILRPEMRPERAPTLDPEGRVRDAGASDFLDATMRRVLPGDYLRKVDVASSAHGLEVRPPLLGNQVLQCAARIPVGLKMAGGRPKALLRRLLTRYLPKEVTEAPKWGFGIPLDSWLDQRARRHLRVELEKSEALNSVILPAYLREVLGSFECGKWNRRKYSRFMLTQRFYHLWSLHRWLERWSPSW